MNNTTNTAAAHNAIRLDNGLLGCACGKWTAFATDDLAPSQTEQHQDHVETQAYLARHAKPDDTAAMLASFDYAKLRARLAAEGDFDGALLCDIALNAKQPIEAYADAESRLTRTGIYHHGNFSQGQALVELETRMS